MYDRSEFEYFELTGGINLKDSPVYENIRPASLLPVRGQALQTAPSLLPGDGSVSLLMRAA